MLGVLRGRTPLGASVGQNPAVVFYVATMFTLIVLVMHVWLRKHSEETATRLAAQQRLAKQPANRDRNNGSRLNETDDSDKATTPPAVDSVEDEFAFFAARQPPRSDASGDAAANEESATTGALLMTAMDERDLSDETPWFMKWFRKKVAFNLAQKSIKTRKHPEKVL